MANGWLSKDPFLSYKAKLKVVERPYLTKEASLQFSNLHTLLYS